MFVKIEDATLESWKSTVAKFVADVNSRRSTATKKKSREQNERDLTGDTMGISLDPVALFIFLP